MRKWFVLAVASVTAFGCGSSQFQDFIQNNPGANLTGLLISPKPVNKRVGQTQQFVTYSGTGPKDPSRNNIDI